ncbi:hypothetical protein IV203_024829 [Nitzschia inconspicua]|uniref:Uncharacterized protein n=1 Tax=Nitzschia inconspicua TaxID=303405 RepID=A0A9K3K9X5_9STRA|nr:hypothetical protein IV203_024829 [Nitzschia inconspicua]
MGKLWKGNDLVEDGITPPTPDEVVGDLSGAGTESSLRKSDKYKLILIWFTRCVVYKTVDTDNMDSTPYSDWVDATLGAFIILTYVNGYATWCGPPAAINTKRLYTKKITGKGKYQGWEEQDMAVYSNLVELITDQRAVKEASAEGDGILCNFDRDLMVQYRRAKINANKTSAQDISTR